MDLSESWSTRFDWMRAELGVIESNVDADDIEVKTYPKRTVVQLTYEHPPIYGDDE